jgi:hypothetical protein
LPRDGEFTDFFRRKYCVSRLPAPDNAASAKSAKSVALNRNARLLPKRIAVSLMGRETVMFQIRRLAVQMSWPFLQVIMHMGRFLHLAEE